MRGVVQGVAPSLEEAAQTLRADRRAHLLHGDAAAAQARAWPMPSWSASSRASPTSATRSWWAASSRCCRPRSSSPSSARSTTRAAPPRWPGCSRCSRSACSRCSAACSASRTTPPSAARAMPASPMRAARRRAPRSCYWRRAAVDRVHAGGLPVRLRRRLRADLGPRLHASRSTHFKTAFALEWGQFGLVWAGTAWNSLFTTRQARRHRGADHRRRSAC